MHAYKTMTKALYEILIITVTTPITLLGVSSIDLSSPPKVQYNEPKKSTKLRSVSIDPSIWFSFRRLPQFLELGP